MYGMGVAAVIVEAVGYNSGCMIGKQEFVDAQRELARKHDVLQIADETLSGFRMGAGRVQESSWCYP